MLKLLSAFSSILRADVNNNMGGNKWLFATVEEEKHCLRPEGFKHEKILSLGSLHSDCIKGYQKS